MTLNFDNVEEFIFLNKNVQKLLPEHKNIFGQWALGKQVPSLNFLSQKALAILLDSLSIEQIKILEDYFQDNILVETIAYSSVKNFEFGLSENLNIDALSNNFCITRDDDKLYMTFIR